MISKHVAIVDGLWSGHHPTYIKTFAKILLEEGCRVSVFCPSPSEVSLFLADNSNLQAYYYEDSGMLTGKWIPGRIRQAITCLSRWRSLKRTINRELGCQDKPEFVFFAWLDSYLNGYVPAWLIDSWFPIRWSGLYFHPRHLRNANKLGVLRNKGVIPPERLVIRSKYASGLAVLDEGVIPKLSQKFAAKAVYLFPDFVDDVIPAKNDPLIKQIRAHAKGRKIIGLLGSLEKRKGFLTLLDIAEQNPNEDWYFVFVGAIAEASFCASELSRIRLLEAEGSSNCFFYLKKIMNDAQFNALIDAVDVVYAVYEDFPHSSNLVTKAAKYRRPVLVNQEGYMAEVVHRYRLGAVVAHHDVNDIRAGIKRFTTGGKKLEASSYKEYMAKQSQNKLRQALAKLISS